MPAGAQLSVTDQRRAARHSVDHHLMVEHLARGKLKLHMANISAQGFMIDDAPGVARGDRAIIPLPIIGRIEAYCIWTADRRAGFQFERLIRPDDFAQMLEILRPRRHPRGAV